MQMAGHRELETRIDAALTHAAALSQWPVTVDVKNIPRPVADLVVRKYRMSGWSASIVDDLRGGDFVQIEAP